MASSPRVQALFLTTDKFTITMILNKRILRQPCVAAGIIMLVLNGFVISAKSGGAPASSEQIFSLSDFNPVGDGVADDGPALQRALDALADAGGGTLFIPAGRYFVKTPVMKDFSGVSGGKVKILGVPSLTMPASPQSNGQDLAAGLDLTSEIIPATGEHHDAIRITNLQDLLIEHVAFVGQPSAFTDAFVTLYLSEIDKITLRHSEFYGISTFGLRAGFGGGNVVRAVRSDMSIESTVFLGCTANSGAYAPVVENLEWRRFSISNSIFLDYGLRPFFGKTGLGAPLSWINMGDAAKLTPESSRREVVIRDTFLDEGGWVGISVFPHRFGATTPIDLVYISGLKMNVSNLGTAGHIFYDVRNLLIENSHYGWSHNTIAAVDINRLEHAILNRLTCIDDADRIRADERTVRLTVINSEFAGIDSLAQTTTVLETTPEQDPVQFVRRQFTSILGRQPDPAGHFYWSDKLIKCGSDNACLSQQRSALSEYLANQPDPDFALTGTVIDENGVPLSGTTVSLTGSQSSSVVTDSEGHFRFSRLPTSGRYTVTPNKLHYNFDSSSQTVVQPGGDVAVDFDARLNRHAIRGRIATVNGTGISGVTVQLVEAPAITATTDPDGFYLFPELVAGENYTVVPSMNDFVFSPVTVAVDDLAADRTANFGTERVSFSLTGSVTDETGTAVPGAAISLSGSESSSALTDSEGNFHFSGLPVSGGYVVAVNKQHYTFDQGSKTFERPTNNVNVVFRGRLSRHSIAGRITRADGTGFGGVMVQLAPGITATTDANGFYSFAELTAGESYTVIPSSGDFLFDPVNTTFSDLSADRAANFTGKLQPELLLIESSELAVALDSVSFMAQPLSLLSSLGFSTDGFVRVMIFGKNVDATNASQVSVVAEGDAGQTYPLEVEFIGEVPGQSWLKQLNLKISPTTLGGKCVQLKLAVAEVSSNNGRICIGNVTSSSVQAR